MKEFKIEVPKGYVVDKDNSTFEKIVFKKEGGYPYSWEDLVIISGYYANSQEEDGYNTLFINGVKSEPNYADLFPTKEEAEASIALAQLLHLANAWGRVDLKHAQRELNFYYSVHVGDAWFSRLFIFEDEEIRDKFQETFADLIKKASPLL